MTTSSSRRRASTPPRARGLVDALEHSFLHALRSGEGEAAPAALLWADADKQWAALVARLQTALPHLFVLGTTAPPAKEVRVTATGDWLSREMAAAWRSWFEPVGAARWRTALWHTAVWALFAAAYITAVVFVASGLDRDVGEVVLVVAAGMRLASYIGGTAGELGFLRGHGLLGQPVARRRHSLLLCPIIAYQASCAMVLTSRS